MKIGFILPLSGEWAQLGAGVRNGALMAESEGVELYFEDNRGELVWSAALARGLIADRKVDALVSIISGVAHVIKPIAARSRIFHVGICSDTAVADGEFNFVNYLTAEQGVGQYVEQFRLRYPGLNEVAVISQNEAGFRRIVDKLATTDLRITVPESYNRGETDFRSMLLRLKQRSPRVVLLLGLSPEIELIAEQAASLGIKPEWSSIESFGLSTRPEVFEGSWFVDSEVPDEEFADEYRKRFGIKLTAGVWQSFQAVNLLKAGLIRARAVNGVIAGSPSVREVRQGRVLNVR